MNSTHDFLAQPESRTFDRKREEVSLEKALRTLVAFANTAGGTLALGVADDGSVLGVSSIQMQEERYANAIASSIEPPLVPDLQCIEVEGKDVLLVRVPRFPGPFYVRAEGPDDGVYIRLGSTNRQASANQREELRRLASAQTFDERPCLGASANDIDTVAVEKAFQNSERTIASEKLETLGVLVRHGDELIPSNGGVILFGTTSARARFFPNAQVRCARFGSTKADIIDRLDIEDSVLHALDIVPRFIRRNTRMSANIEGVRRQDISEYDSLALREVMANAVAHADYSQSGMNIRVQIFDDFLEIENPGGWPIGFSEGDFKDGISRVRNPVVARVLHELKIIESWGSGYQRIVAASEVRRHPVPEWRETGPVLRVRFAPHPLVIKDANARANDTMELDLLALSELLSSLNERQRWMLTALRGGGPISAPDIAKRFRVNPRTARRDVHELRQQGFVRLEGTHKSGGYVLDLDGIRATSGRGKAN